MLFLVQIRAVLRITVGVMGQRLSCFSLTNGIVQRLARHSACVISCTGCPTIWLRFFPESIDTS